MTMSDWDAIKNEMIAEREAFDAAEPIFSGLYLITREWEIVLPAPLRREVKGDRVMLWRPHLTLWLGAHEYNDRGSMQVVHDTFLASHQKNPFMPPMVQERAGMKCGACTLMEKDDVTGHTQPVFSGWVAAEQGFVTMQMYYSNMEVDTLGWESWQTIRPAQNNS